MTSSLPPAYAGIRDLCHPSERPTRALCEDNCADDRCPELSSRFAPCWRIEQPSLWSKSSLHNIVAFESRFPLKARTDYFCCLSCLARVILLFPPRCKRCPIQVVPFYPPARRNLLSCEDSCIPTGFSLGTFPFFLSLPPFLPVYTFYENSFLFRDEIPVLFCSFKLHSSFP